MKIDDLNLSARAYNCLFWAGIDTVEKLIQLSDVDLVSIRHMNAALIEEIRQKQNEVLCVSSNLLQEDCRFCNEDIDGYRKVLGAFSISNPFHGRDFYLNAGKLKPRKINFCFMCGRRLSMENMR